MRALFSKRDFFRVRTNGANDERTRRCARDDCEGNSTNSVFHARSYPVREWNSTWNKIVLEDRVAAYYPAESQNIFASSRGRHCKAKWLSLSRKFVARVVLIVTISAVYCIILYIIN